MKENILVDREQKNINNQLTIIMTRENILVESVENINYQLAITLHKNTNRLKWEI